MCVCICARAHVSDLLSVADVPVPSICNDGVIVAACADTQAVVCEQQARHSKAQGHVYITGCVCTIRASPRRSIKLALCNKLKACKELPFQDTSPWSYRHTDAHALVSGQAVLKRQAYLVQQWLQSILTGLNTVMRLIAVTIFVVVTCADQDTCTASKAIDDTC